MSKPSELDEIVDEFRLDVWSHDSYANPMTTVDKFQEEFKQQLSKLVSELELTDEQRQRAVEKGFDV